MTTADPNAPALVAQVRAQNAAIDFPSLDHADAYALGSDLVRRGVEGGLTIAISIVFGEQRVFHAALAGTSSDNDDWLARKLRTVARLDAPSLLLSATLRATGTDLSSMPHLDPAVYAASGGGFPLRVRGLLVGGVAVSGLTEYADHDLAVEALEALQARKG